MGIARVVITVAAACLAAAAAGAMTCSIVSSFLSPAAGQQILGLDYYNGHLYHSASMGFHLVYETDLMGSVISSFEPPHGTSYLEVDADGIWMGMHSPEQLLFRMTTTGRITASYPLSFRPIGITRQGDWLWFTLQWSPNMPICKTTTVGSVIASYPALGGAALFDLDFYGGYLWIPYGPLSHPDTAIYKYTTTGSLVDYVQPFPGAGRPGGVCWDGTYLWAVDMDAPGYCYKMTCSPNPAIEPASFGKVKALFR
jgi:hypothetical protein